MAAVVGGGWRDPGSIGGAISRELARRGADVAVIERDLESGRRTVEEIEREGGVAALVSGDVGTEAGARHIVEAITARFGRLDVLVNNIGIGAGGTVVEAGEEDWDLVLNLSVKAAARMSKLAIPLMDGDGVIVNTSSVAALTPGEHATYTVAKAALEGLTRAIALYHGREGIRANAVRVGEVATWRVVAELAAADAEAILDRRRAGARSSGPRAMRGTSRARSCSWPATRRAGSRDRCSRSTAARA